MLPKFPYAERSPSGLIRFCSLRVGKLNLSSDGQFHIQPADASLTALNAYSFVILIPSHFIVLPSVSCNSSSNSQLGTASVCYGSQPVRSVTIVSLFSCVSYLLVVNAVVVSHDELPLTILPQFRFCHAMDFIESLSVHKKSFHFPFCSHFCFHFFISAMFTGNVSGSPDHPMSLNATASSAAFQPLL